jgi:hypothetical protein
MVPDRHNVGVASAETHMLDEPFPYNLPIWRRSHVAVSPDGLLTATLYGREVSMGNPTIGTLNLSNGIGIANCNPSFVWSEDSRYLAVPPFRLVLGL